MRQSPVNLKRIPSVKPGSALEHMKLAEGNLTLVPSDKRARAAGSMSKPAPVPVSDGAEYQRVQPGRYSAVAVRVQGPEWVRSYRRWSLIVEFELLGESDSVRGCAFFNMGNDPQGPKPGRQSRYFRAWTIANGELPRKGQAMDPGVFLEGQQFEIEVEDCKKDTDDNLKSDAEVYSKVIRIHCVHWPNRPI